MQLELLPLRPGVVRRCDGRHEEQHSALIKAQRRNPERLGTPQPNPAYSPNKSDNEAGYTQPVGPTCNVFFHQVPFDSTLTLYLGVAQVNWSEESFDPTDRRRVKVGTASA